MGSKSEQVDEEDTYSDINDVASNVHEGAEGAQACYHSVSTLCILLSIVQVHTYDMTVSKGSQNMKDNPMDPLTIMMPWLEEMDSESMGHSWHDLHSSSTVYIDLPNPHHIQTPLYPPLFLSPTLPRICVKSQLVTYD